MHYAVAHARDPDRLAAHDLQPDARCVQKLFSQLTLPEAEEDDD